MTWLALLAGCAGCYVVKLAGLSVPARLLTNSRMQQVATLLPVALLATLTVVQAFSSGQQLRLDARAAGLAVALAAVLLRAPFVVVVVLAVGVTALLRLAR